MTERLLLQYRVAFGLVVLGIGLAIGIVARASYRIHALGSDAPRAAIHAALSEVRFYIDVAVAVTIIGMIVGVVTTLQSQPAKKQ